MGAGCGPVGFSATGIEGLLQVNIEWNHAPLDIHVLNDDFLGPVAGARGDLQLAGRKFLDFGQ